MFKELVKIEVMSRDLVQLYVRKNKNMPKSIIVSISCLDEEYPEFPQTIKEGDVNSKIYDIFFMKFNDLDSDYKDEHYTLLAPKLKDFYGLKEFIDNNVHSVEQIIVHCGAGVSRSAGCALAIAEYLNIDFQLNPKLHIPNNLVYKLAKQEFGIYKDQNYYEDFFQDR